MEKTEPVYEEEEEEFLRFSYTEKVGSSRNDLYSGGAQFETWLRHRCFRPFTQSLREKAEIGTLIRTDQTDLYL
jgi:hypothetical protein